MYCCSIVDVEGEGRHLLEGLAGPLDAEVYSLTVSLEATEINRAAQ